MSHIFLRAFVLLSIFFSGCGQPVPPRPVIDDSSDVWSVYTHEPTGLSVSYPNTMKKGETRMRDGGVVAFYFPEQPGTNLLSASAEYYFSGWPCGGVYGRQIGTIRQSGYDFIKSSFFEDPMHDRVDVVNYVTRINKRCYTFELVMYYSSPDIFRGADGQLSEGRIKEFNREEIENTFEQIFKTVQITVPEDTTEEKLEWAIYQNSEHNFSFAYPVNRVVIMATTTTSGEIGLSVEDKEKNLIFSIDTSRAQRMKNGTFKIQTDFLSMPFKTCPRPFWVNKDIFVAESGFGDGGWADHWYNFVLDDGTVFRILTQTYDYFHNDEDEERKREQERRDLEYDILKTFRLGQNVNSVPFECTPSKFE